MVRALFSLGFLLFSGGVWAQQYVISTIAGGAPPSNPTAAIQASIGDPPRVAADAAGNVYFGSLHSVFRVDPSGTMTRVAGNGRAGNSGDGGPATDAQLRFPAGMAVDAAGNLYVADRDASVVRKFAPGGTISTVAGTGEPGNAGDGAQAASAQLNGPLAVAIDTAGSLFIADTGNNVVRKVASSGVITTVAGTGERGFRGDGGPAREAWLDGPEGVAVDGAGNLYIADTFNGRVRRVAADGTITTAAGNGSTGIFGGDNNPAAGAALSLPPDVTVDRQGNLYIADFGNSRIRMVANGIITTVAGSTRGAPPADGEAAVNARFSGPTGVAIAPNGTVYFAEGTLGSGTGLAHGDFRIWKVSTEGILSTLAGNGVPSYSGDGGAGSTAQLNGAAGVAIDGFGNLYVADTLNQRVRKIAPGGTITTITGTGTPGFSVDFGAPAAAQVDTPRGLAVDASGNVYLADTRNSRVRKIAPGGNIFTYAGNGNASYFGDTGPANRASVNQPEGVALDAAGNLYIADTLDHAVRKVTTDGTITTIAGFGGQGFGGDGGPATSARLMLPRAVAVDVAGNVYVADTGNHRVRKIDPLGVITTVAGNGETAPDVEGGPALSVPLSDPRGLALDRAGNLYIADTGHNRVRKVSPDGVITTIAGNGTCCYSGDGGIATAAQLNQPWGLAVDVAGNVYVADSGNSAVRVLHAISSTLRVNAVTNAASNLAGAVAPGEVVAVYGSGLGPAQTVPFQAGADGLVSTALVGTSVLFNGVAGAVLYTSGGQVGVVAPYALTGTSVQVSVQYQGLSTAPLTVPVAAAAPGVFTVDGSGRGPAAALNQDGKPNSAANPAAAGTVVTLFATGEGQTSPPGVDGKPASAPLPQPVLPVTVTIGGVAADVQYAGAAPQVVAGVMQVNAVVPSGVTGAAAVVVTVGGAASQSGVTVAVR